MTDDKKSGGMPPKGEPEDQMGPFLKAAFELDPMDTPRLGDSVVETLKKRSGLSKRIKLKDSHDSADKERVSQSNILKSYQEMSARYQVLSEIGRGGLGIVMKSLDADLGRDVAMKLLADHNAYKPEMILRLIEEAQIGGQLQHPGIVPVYDVGLRSDQRPFFTMKLVKGETLGTLLGARKDPNEERMRYLRIFEQVCQTVAYTHTRGVIHRDLKPTNIMVGSFGEVLLMDWGLAKVLHHADNDEGEKESGKGTDEEKAIRTASSSHESKAGVVMGTYAYMAPEQARGEIENLNEQTDVFGLGAILCEILTGLPPFSNEDRYRLKEDAREGRLDSCLSRLDACSADSEIKILAKQCLAVNAADRPKDAGMVAKEMEAYLSAVDERAHRSELQATEARVRAEEAEARAKHERRARRFGLSLAATVLIAVVFGAVGYLWVEDDKRQRIRINTEAVNEAMDNARQLRDKALAAGDGDIRAWTLALEVGFNAKRMLRTKEVDSDTKGRVERFVAKLEEEVSATRKSNEKRERDQAMIRSLEDIRIIMGGQSDWESMRNALDSAFRDYGIDIEDQSPEDAATLIRESNISRELVTGLRGWKWARRVSKLHLHNKKLNNILHLCDPDPWLFQLLNQVSQESDPKEIRELVFSINPKEISPFDVQEVVFTLRHVGAYDIAATYLAHALEIYPDNFWLNYSFGHILSSKVKPPRKKEAIGRYWAALAIQPWNHAAWGDLGVALMNDGQKEKARRAYERSLELKPNNPLNHLNYGVYLTLVTRQYEEAIHHLKIAHKLRPDHGETLTSLGTAYLQRCEYEKALDAFDRALLLNPRNYTARSNKAITLMKQGELQGGLAVFDEVIKIHPNVANTYWFKGNSLEESGQLDEAIEAYRQGIKVNPNIASIHFWFGRALYRKGDLDEAAHHLNEAIVLDKEVYEGDHYTEADIYYYLGCTYREMGDLERAEKHLKTALDMNPYLIDAHLELGRMSHTAGDLEDASDCFENLILRDNSNWKAWFNLGKVRLDQGILEEAQSCFEEVNIIVENADAYAEIGHIYLERNDDILALDALEHALRIDPKHYSAHFHLASVYIMKMQYEDALETAQVALSLAPPGKKREALNLVGDCQVKLGLKQEAEESFRQAMEANTPAPDVR